MKYDSMTLLGIIVVCLTLCYTVNQACKCAVACEAVKAGQLNLKVK